MEVGVGAAVRATDWLGSANQLSRPPKGAYPHPQRQSTLSLASQHSATPSHNPGMHLTAGNVSAGQSVYHGANEEKISARRKEVGNLGCYLETYVGSGDYETLYNRGREGNARLIGEDAKRQAFGIGGVIQAIWWI
ncbi:unnamed protein product [Sphagnum balticum]